MARILLLTECFWPVIGGIELRARQFLPAMRKRGHESLIVTSREPNDTLFDREVYRGVEVARLKMRAALTSGSPVDFIRVRREYAALKAEFRPDVVHHFYGGTIALLEVESHRRELPLLASFTGWPRQAMAGPRTILGRLLQQASWVTGNSARLTDVLRDMQPSIRERSSVVYSGNPWPSIEAAPLPMAPPIILCIGRMIERKGFDVMVRAMPAIAAQFPGANLWIAGDGPEMTPCQNLAAEVGVAENVRFFGWVDPDKISELINEATMVVIPSRPEEPFATVAIQAMQMARPIVVTRSGGMAEAVVDGETGFLVEPESSDALAVVVLRLLGDPTAAAAMGKAGQERAHVMHGWNRYLDDFDALYRRLATDAHVGPRCHGAASSG